MATLETGHFHSPERLSFHLKHQQILFLGLFRTKTKKVQFSIFQLKEKKLFRLNSHLCLHRKHINLS